MARQLGAEIKIVNGFVVPWADNRKPFAPVLAEIQRRGKEAKDAGDDVMAELWKLIGNTLYGKFGQGLKGKRAFNSRKGSRELIPMCPITSPFVAALLRVSSGRPWPRLWHLPTSSSV